MNKNYSIDKERILAGERHFEYVSDNLERETVKKCAILLYNKEYKVDSNKERYIILEHKKPIEVVSEIIKDDSGKIIKTQLKNMCTDYIYNEDGNISEKITLNGQDETSREVYKYNNCKQLVTKTKIKQDKKLIDRYFYNGENTIKQTFTDEVADENKTHSVTLNKDGLAVYVFTKIDPLVKADKHIAEYFTTFDYDNYDYILGTTKSVRTYNGKNHESKFFIVFDKKTKKLLSKSRITETNNEIDDIEEFLLINKYNEKGDIISKSDFVNNIKTTYDYEYDDKGRMISKKTYHQYIRYTI